MFLFTFMRKRLCLRTTCPEKNLEFQAVWKMGASGERNCQARYEQHVDRAIYLTLVATRCRLGPSSAQLIRKNIQLVPMAITLQLHADASFDSQKCDLKWDRRAKIDLVIVILLISSATLVG